MHKALVSLLSLAAASHAAIRGAQKPCTIRGRSMVHFESHYLTGNEFTPGSIYAVCRNGNVECYVEEAKADKPNAVTVDCAEVDLPHRKLQILEKDKRYHWPQGVVCYHPISTSRFSSNERSILNDAFEHFHKKTNLKFIPIRDCSGSVCGNCQHGLEFTKGGGCWSYIGYTRKQKQEVSMATSCFYSGIKLAVHELGHAVGMYHEHTHPDRNLIMVPQLFGDREPSKFKKVDPSDYLMRSYDPLSAMHYEFNYDKGRCIPKGDASSYCDIGESGNCRKPKPSDCDIDATERMEDRRGRELSSGDIRALAVLYPGGNSNPPSPTPSPPPSKRVCDKNDGNIGSCCTDTKSCGVGQGDCDSDSDCLSGLKCGSNNCLSDFNWGGSSTDCCYKPSPPTPTPPPSRVCDKNDGNIGSCCTDTKSCGVGQGDCDSDSDCLSGLKCGSNNCLSDFNWGGSSTDCCYKPSSPTPPSRVCDKNDARIGSCCSVTKSCDVGQGDCDSDNDCLPGLKCGNNNCRPHFDWGFRSTDCCYKP